MERDQMYGERGGRREERGGRRGEGRGENGLVSVSSAYVDLAPPERSRRADRGQSWAARQEGAPKLANCDTPGGDRLDVARYPG